MAAPEVDPVFAEVDQLRAEIKERSDRIGALLKLRSHPTVIPVQVYWQHHRQYEDPYVYGGEEWDVLREAYKSLESMSDHGFCSPVGVSVNGVLLDEAELARRYPEVISEVWGT